MTEKLTPLKPYEPNWPHGYCTRDGRPARVICTDVLGLFPLIALVCNSGDEFIKTYSACGRFSNSGGESHLDLMCAAPPEPEPRPLIERWDVYSAKGTFLGIKCTPSEAEKARISLDEMREKCAPHRVVHMREVRS